MRQSTFRLDATGDKTFSGLTTGDDWNGWATPLFTQEQGLGVVAGWQAQGWEARFDEVADKFVFSINHDFETGCSDEFEAFPAIEVEGQKLYGIGAYSWMWEEVEEEPVGA